ncbi:hypothetical protein GCM10011585_29230 [Edaphobacter dinghuensis]|uniref:Uncharacterized protein n=1 Tax=Edaphobacter dinghuensis TaxID=1560005 RepID=A0A917M799_9BACT|nr:hypothetical protein GCM10011585_29230 [Edaphobacter dinghuensis]
MLRERQVNAHTTLALDNRDLSAPQISAYLSILPTPDYRAADYARHLGDSKYEALRRSAMY